MRLLSLRQPERLATVQAKWGSATRLAEHLNVAVTSVTRTLSGEIASQNMQTRIAKACGTTRDKMFGAGNPAREAIARKSAKDRVTALEMKRRMSGSAA